MSTSNETAPSGSLTTDSKYTYYELRVPVPDSMSEVVPGRDTKSGTKLTGLGYVSPPFGPKPILLVPVVDESGSMTRNYHQVQEAGRILMEMTEGLSHVTTRCVLYSSHARSGPLDLITSAPKLCGTSFTDAFRELGEVLIEFRSGMPDETRVIVVFMSDGMDKGGYAAAESFHAQVDKGTFGSDVTVHSVAFGADHDFGLMSNTIPTCGSSNSKGIYRYASPTDGSGALKAKLTQIFGHVLGDQTPTLTATVTIAETTTFPANVTVGRDGVAVITGLAKNSHPLTLPSETVCVDLSTKTESHVAIIDTGKVRVVDESTPENAAFVIKTAPLSISSMSRRLLSANPATADQTKRKIIRSELAPEAENLRGQLSAILEAASAPPTALPRRKTRAQREAELGTSGPETREELTSLIAQITVFLAVLDQMVQTTLSPELRARLESMKYDHVFTTQRRNVLMDKRRMASAGKLQDNDNALKNLVPLEDISAELSSEDREFYECDVSGVTAEELLTEPKDGDADLLSDVLGIGLSVKRNELAVDDPTTGMQFGAVSTSLFSAQAFEDACKYQISIAGEAQTHGGFAFVDNFTPHATVDRARSEVNAFLPLYVCPAHWERAKLLYPKSLAYFCTLDPTAFAMSQYHVVFTILGAMVSRLPASPGEREFQVIEAWRKTATRVMTDLFPKAAKVLQNFMEKPWCRGPSAFGNVFTMVGYAVAFAGAPEEFRDEHGGDIDPTIFLHFLRAEQLRRATNKAFLEMERAGTAPPESLIKGLLLSVICPEVKTPRGITFRHLLDRVVPFDPTPNAEPGDLTDDDIRNATPVDITEEEKKSRASNFDLHVKMAIERNPESFSQPEYIPTRASTVQFEATGNSDTCTAVISTLLPPFHYAYHPQVYAYLSMRAPVPVTREKFTALVVDGASIWSGKHGVAGQNAPPENEADAVAAAIMFRRHATLRAIEEGAPNTSFPGCLTYAGWYDDPGRFLIHHVAAPLHQDYGDAVKREEVLQWRRKAAQAALLTAGTSEFITRFCDAFRTRDALFAVFCEGLANKEAEIPLRREKMEMIMLGRMPRGELPALKFFNGGNVWVPPPKVKKAFATALGSEVFKELMADVMKHVTVHIYRDGLPNRHGHSNENPSLWAMKGGQEPAKEELAEWHANKEQ